MFVARGLTAGDAHLAYPLVSCRYPALSLALWTSYVRAAERADAAERLICLVDQRDRRHAIFAYGVEGSRPLPRLRVAHIATFQLIGDLIHRALHQTLEQLAAEHGCREVIVETWKGCDDVSAVSGAAPSASSVPTSCLPDHARRVLTLDSTISHTGALN